MGALLAGGSWRCANPSGTQVNALEGNADIPWPSTGKVVGVFSKDRRPSGYPNCGFLDTVSRARAVNGPNARL